LMCGLLRSNFSFAMFGKAPFWKLPGHPWGGRFK
jgi:hypothetical protein